MERRIHTLLAPAILAGLVLLASSCAGGLKGVGHGAREWADGPVRWLMLPEEMRAFRSLRGSRQVLEFIEAFWQRRDAAAGPAESSYRRMFFDRVEAADRLYGEEDLRGSLSDRGRALILLGPPPVLRYRQRAVPALAPGRESGRVVAESKPMFLEVWAYPVDALPRRIAEAVEGREEIQLTFVVEGSRTYLLEGERFLDLARRASVGEVG